MKNWIRHHLTVIVGLTSGLLAAVVICGFDLVTHLTMTTYLLSFVAVISLGMTAPWPGVVKWCQRRLEK